MKDLVTILSVENVESVFQMYKTNITPDMKAVLINVSTNNETYFFRDVKPFKVFSTNIIPELLVRVTGNTQLNVWSAASSSGQEAFSMLMSAQNTLGDSGSSRLSLFASDISTNALNKAKKGLYNGLDVQRGLPITFLMKHFTQVENENWQINSNILSRVKFFEFNLLKDKFPKEMYHVIFCRNVLIYQDKDNKNKILNNVYDALTDGGYMFLGNGESLIGIDTSFERVTIDGYTFYKKEKKMKKTIK
ncbi:MAG: protein-glutamate O-methyltransferase CheR [Bacteriovorax sp.]|nr:protein-glutamate O-methyltransferase CheR [Bacteriovorax sp.]